MFPIVIALFVLIIAVCVIYLLLKNMGEEGIEVAAPGSCKSGRCGVSCAPVVYERHEAAEEILVEPEPDRQKLA